MRKLNNVVITFIIMQLLLYPANIIASENYSIPNIEKHVAWSLKNRGIIGGHTYGFGNFNVDSKRWVHYATNGLDYLFFYDTKSITKSNEIVKVWIKYFGPKAVKNSQGTFVLGVVKVGNVLQEFACNTRTVRDLEWNMSLWNGKSDESSGVTGWENIAPETITEKLYDAVCK